ncbi:hypothetical protein D3C75_894440 [compost metagenome]
MEDVRQHLVRTVADEHLCRGHAVVLGHRLLQPVTVRVRVQAQVVVQLAAHGLQRLGRRAVGVFVGVQLDQAGQLGLLARHVRHQVLDEGAPESTHAQFPFSWVRMRYSALRAWAVSDSPRARTEAVWPSSDAPCSEQKMIDERFWKS